MKENNYKHYTTYKKLFNIKFDIKKNFNKNKINISISPLGWGKEMFIYLTN